MVVLASIGIAIAAMAFKDQMEDFHPVGGMIGTSVSAAFLLLIGAINLVVLVNVYQGLPPGEERRQLLPRSDLQMLTAGGGLFARIFRRLFGLIGRSWHMYPLGFLFGLGFDTATEVALLGITAAQASSGLSMWSILVFPRFVHRRHDAARHHRQRADGARLWLGLRQAGAQALLQHDHHVRVGDGRACWSAASRRSD